MREPNRIHLPWRVAAAMIWNYAKIRVTEQVKAVAFIVLYLVGFQMLVLKTTPSDALHIAAGLGMVVSGLAFFLEGLFLGLMPLGERVGVQLPQRSHLVVIVAFGLLLGVGSTLAEPAIASLRVAGLNVTPWDAPLLYRLLETQPGHLVVAIAAGVGVAVACGMIRSFFGFSLKVFLFSIVPLVLGVTAYCSLDANLATILNLAWDTGGVTTGPVTVPLILALGIGVSRSAHQQEGATDGFGIIALASVFPVLGVLVLGFLLNPTTPKPLSEAEFFSASHRPAALALVRSEQDLAGIAFQRGGESARRAFFADETAYVSALRSLLDPVQRLDLLGKMPLEDWLLQRASSAEQAWMAAETHRSSSSVSERPPVELAPVVTGEARLAVRAIIPLISLLLVVMVLLLRDRPRRPDEVVLGIVFALIGMTILTSGIKLGLAPLGDQVGRPLPRVFRSVAREEGRMMLEGFDLRAVFPVFSAKGVPESHFYLKDESGVPIPVPFDPARFDQGTRRYEHVVKRPPLFGPQLTLIGIGLVFLFAFGMGYGSTMAEPALSALGRSVEEMTVGTIKRVGVVRAVSLGVGIGLMVGVARILYDISMVWLLVPSYLATLALTYWSEDDLVGIAWDSGGVTTGPITVPLVLAMGLGIGGGLNIVDGFGIVAMASVFPVLTTLTYGMLVRFRQRQIHPVSEEVDHDE